MLKMWADIKVHVARAHIVKQKPCSTLENTFGKIQGGKWHAATF
jgi:hypothetical protein